MIEINLEDIDNDSRKGNDFLLEVFILNGILIKSLSFFFFVVKINYFYFFFKVFNDLWF